VADGFAVQNIFVSDFNSHNFLKFSELLDWDIHALHLPMRIFASVYADS